MKGLVASVLLGCLSRCCSSVSVLQTTCAEIKRVVNEGAAGLYAFVDDEKVYYVGATANARRRVGVEHCGARIGSFEGVVRFLMLLLDRVCADTRVRGARSVVEREEVVSEIIREFLGKLSMVLAICSKKPSRECLVEAEKCAVTKLSPLLNPHKPLSNYLADPLKIPTIPRPQNAFLLQSALTPSASRPHKMERALCCFTRRCRGCLGLRSE